MASKRYRITLAGVLDLKSPKKQLDAFVSKKTIDIAVNLKDLDKAKKQLEDLLNLGDLKKDVDYIKDMYDALFQDIEEKKRKQGGGSYSDEAKKNLQVSFRNWKINNEELLSTSDALNNRAIGLKKNIDDIGKAGSKTTSEARRSLSALRTDVNKFAKDGRAVQKLDDDFQKYSYTLDRIYSDNKALIDSQKDINDEYKQMIALLEQFKNGQVSTAKFNLEMKKFKDKVRDAKDESWTLAQTWENLSDKITSGILAAKAIEGIISILKKAVVQVKELDDSLVEIQKVVALDGSALEEFKEQAFEVGATVGRTGKEIIDATAEFKRSGYTLRESLELGEAANIMLNVADGMNKVDDSAAVLISTMKAYNIAAKDAYTINDILNEVSNTSAITFDDLAEGVRRTAAVYGQSGTELEELTGLLTAANEIMQDIEKTSSGLNTISQRLRGIKDAGDETSPTISKLQKDFKSYANVDILDPVTGQLRGTYDILKDTAMAWEGLDENTRQYLGELAAGKRQVNVFNALMLNFSKALSATSSAYNSMNSAQEENARFMDSIQGKLNNFNSAWQQVSANAISSDFVKLIIDVGTALLHLADKLGGVNTAMGLLVGGAMIKWNNSSAKMISGLTKMISESALAGTWIETLGKAMEGTALKATLLKAAVFGVIAGLVTLVASKVAEYIYNTSDAFEDLNTEIDENKSKINSLNSELDQLKSKGSLTEGEKEQLELLEKEIALRERALALQEKQKAEMTFTFGDYSQTKVLDDGTVEIPVVYKPDEDNEFNITKITEDLTQIPEKIKEINELKIQAVDDGDVRLINQYDRQISDLEDNLVTSASIGQEAFNAFNKAVKNNASFAEGVRNQYNKLGEVLPSVVNNILGIKEAVNEASIWGQKFNSLGTALTDLKNDLTGVVKVWDEYNATGKISVNTLLDIISNYPSLLQYLELENGQYVLNKNAIVDLFNTKRDAKVLELKQQQEELKSQIKYNELIIKSAILATSATSDVGEAGSDAVRIIKETVTAYLVGLGKTAEESEQIVSDRLGGILKTIADISNSENAQAVINDYKNQTRLMKEQVAALDEQIAYLNGLTLPDFSSKVEKAGSSASKAAEKTEELTDANKELEDALGKAEDKLGDYTDKMDAYFNQITDALDDEIADLEKANEKLEQMGDLFNAFGDYIVEGLEDEIEAIDKAAEAEKDRLQDKLDALEEEEKLNDRNKKLEEARLNIAQAQEALERAKRQKVHIYRDKTGFVYETDFSSVSSAQDQLDEAQGKYDDLVGEYEREDIKDSIKDQMEQVDADAQHKKDKIQSQIDSLNELMGAWGNSTQQMLNNILSQKEAQEWLDEFQSASASKRKQMLEELDEAYYDMVQSELDMNNQRIEDLENLKNDFQDDYDEIKASMDEYRIAEEDLNEFLQLSIEDRKTWLKDLTSTWKSEISSMIAEINRLKAAMNSLEGASVGGGGGGGSSSSGGSSSGSSTNKSPLSPSDYDAVSKLNPVDNPELADKAGEVWDAIVSGNKSEAVQNAIDKAQGKKNKKSYAKGGTRIVDYTGWEKGMANTWVDGTPLKPEVVLNNTDAKKLYDMVHNAPSFNGDNEPNENVVFNIANLELPNVTNASTFVDDLKSYSVNHAIQLSKCRR